MLQRSIVILFAVIISIIYIHVLASNNGQTEIHPFIHSKKSCEECHSNNEMKDLLHDSDKICSILCYTCHKGMQNHHIVDVKINEKLPANFILTRKNKITCITCHDLKNKRFDTSSWKAESLFEKIFTKKSEYKTYFLTKKNDDGQLCKTCH